MSGNKHDDLKEVIFDLLETKPESATMTFDSFHEAINEVVPCERADVAVTVTLMELLGEVQIVKDELGRGRGFALIEEEASAL